MKPIYFPFTYLPSQGVAMLASVFSQTVVYRPSSLDMPKEMQQAVEAGVIEVRTPVSGDEKHLKEILTAYRHWAEIHQGAETALFKLPGYEIPFYEDTAVSRIRSEIRKRKEAPEDTGDDEKTDPLLQARIFLHVAQEHDRNSAEIAKGLDSAVDSEKSLMDNLLGEREDSNNDFFVDSFKAVADDPGDYSTRERIDAWVRLMMADMDHHHTERSGVFITTSRAVFEHLFDNSREAEMSPEITIPFISSREPDEDDLPEKLSEFVCRLARGESEPEDIYDFMSEPGENGSDASITLSFFMVADEMPERYFTKMMKSKTHEPFQVVEEFGGEKIANTYIGLLETTRF